MLCGRRPPDQIRALLPELTWLGEGSKGPRRRSPGIHSMQSQLSCSTRSQGAAPATMEDGLPTTELAPMPPVCHLDGHWHYQFRIILLGDSTVGKTSLLRRYTERCFVPALYPTVGVEFYSKMMELPPGVKVKLQLWDTAGQERFRCIPRSFYRNAVGVLLVFDMTSRRSFENIFEWYNEVTNAQMMEKVIFLLIGHKSDLQSNNRVSFEEAEGLAISLGTHFIETSAKDNVNVDLAFETITKIIYEALLNKEIDLHEGWDGVKVIHKQTRSKPQKRQKPLEGKCQC